MTEEIRNKLIDSAHDEISDIQKYMDMSSEVSGSAGGVLKDIAHDEYTHAKHLIEILKEDGGIPEDLEKEWKECREKYADA
jgi:hypothetical protein